jgi:hypothetical protein
VLLGCEADLHANEHMRIEAAPPPFRIGRFGQSV